MTEWVHAGPSVLAAFLASLVEFVEALTVVLAVGTIRGWRPALAGAGLALVTLAILVVALGPALVRIPLATVQLVVGTLLLLFGLRWLRKAILRAAGIIPLHDETAAYAAETDLLSHSPRRFRAGWDTIAVTASFKIVMLEGIEVVFIVIARRHRRRSGVAGGDRPGDRAASAAGAHPREHAEVCGRRAALRLRRLLGRRRRRPGLARRGLVDPRPHRRLLGRCARHGVILPPPQCRPGAADMKWMLDAARELVALFIDDGSLAIAVLAWVAIAALALPALPIESGWLAVALFAGFAVILAENVLRAARGRTRR
jgi:hypothetical protein